MDQRALLRVTDLRVSYATSRGVLTAVNGVSFVVKRGEALGLVGESGAGKSSLALALMRLLPRNALQFQGRIELDGTDCMALDDDTFRSEVRWRRIAMVFQGAMESLNPVVKVGEQVIEPLLLHGRASRKEAVWEAKRLMELVSLPSETYDRYAHELSGGMKQRVLIAMALVLKPQLLILDEPTSALDVTVQAQVMDLLKDLKRDMGLTLLFITHDIALASDLCDTIGVMYAGRLAEIGTAEGVLRSPSHPYTQLLLNSVPRLHQEEEPQFIPGDPPDMLAPPAGCRFNPRCPYVFERCKLEEPPAFAPGQGQQSWCWLLEGRI